MTPSWVPRLDRRPGGRCNPLILKVSQRFECAEFSAAKVRNVSRLGSQSAKALIPLMVYRAGLAKSFGIRFESCLGLFYQIRRPACGSECSVSGWRVI